MSLAYAAAHFDEVHQHIIERNARLICKAGTMPLGKDTRQEWEARYALAKGNPLVT